MAAAVLIPPFWRRAGKMASPYGLADSHSGHSDAGQAEAQDPADGTVGFHFHRSGHHLSSAVGRNREFSQVC